MPPTSNRYIAPENSFRKLRAELWTRLTNPMGQVSFWVALLIGVVLLGGCGIWVEIIKWKFFNQTLNGVETALHTFFPVLACTATMQVIMVEHEKKYLRSFGWAIGI